MCMQHAGTEQLSAVFNANVSLNDINNFHVMMHLEWSPSFKTIQKIQKKWS